MTPGATAIAVTSEQPAAHVMSQAQAEQMSLSYPNNEPMLVGACPDCGSQLEFAEGCMKCHVCGFSECG
jgi:ribonucleoside-diphosphate reductase alpha chain